MQLFHIIFTEPGKVILEVPCIAGSRTVAGADMDEMDGGREQFA